MRDVLPFMNEKRGHRVPQAVMGDVVGGVGGDGHIAARQLVLALGAGLDACEIVGDGEIDGLVIADLEMQVAMVLDANLVQEIKLSTRERRREKRSVGALISFF